MKSIMSGPNKLPRITLIILLIAYAIVMSQLLNTPYFWDELGVYSEAALIQSHHYPSLMPSSVQPEFSRGHPLLTAMLFSTSFKLFGPHIWVAHGLALLLALLTALVTYRIAEKYFSANIGILAVMLLLVQPLFVAQSILLLPEMLLTLLMLLAIKAFLDGNKWLYFIAACLALLTKEAAVILPFAVIGADLVQHLLNWRNPLPRWRNWLWYLSPLLVFVLFLVVQKAQNGWYFFPLHTSLISFDSQTVFNKLSEYYRFVFFLQGRSTATIMAVVGCVWWLFRQVRQRRILLNQVSLPIITFLIFMVGLLAFSIINFYMNRYMLALLPVYCLLVAIAIWSLPMPQWFKLAAIVVAMCICGARITSSSFDYDNHLGYLHLVKVQTAATHFLEEENLRDARINADYMIYCGLYRDNVGYRTGGPFTKLVGSADEADYIVVFDGTGFDKPQCKYPIALWKSFRDGNQEARIYKVDHSNK